MRRNASPAGGTPVKNERGGKVRAVCRKTESLSAAPAKSRDINFAVRRGELQGVVRCGIQIRRDLVGIQLADSLGDSCGKIFRASAVRGHTAQKVGRDSDVAG